MDKNIEVKLVRLRESFAILQSTKQVSKREALEFISNILTNQDVLIELDKDEGLWLSLFKAAKTSLYTEIVKYGQYFHKHGKITTSRLILTNESRDLLASVCKRANLKSNKAILSYKDFFNYVKDCSSDVYKKQLCLESALLTFNESFLLKDFYWDALNLEDILELMTLLKTLHNNDSNCKALNCYITVIQKGNDYKLPVKYVRDEIDFVKKVVSPIKSTENFSLNESAAQLVLSFCQICGNNYRELCLTEGERLVGLLFCFCDPNHNMPVFKLTLMEIILLQLEYHADIEESSIYWVSFLERLAKFIKESVDRNNSLVIKSTSQANVIVPIFVKITTQCYKQLLSSKLGNVEEPSSKRARSDETLLEIFGNIQSHIQSSWLILFSAVLEEYPDIINEHYYSTLLNTFANYIKDSKSRIIKGHVLKTLAVMLTVEEMLISKNEEFVKNSEAWLSIYDSTIRTIGLNQNITESHELIQKLLLKQQTLISSNETAKILTLYTSDTQQTTHSLLTFQTFRNNYSLPESAPNPQSSNISLIDSILDLRSIAKVSKGHSYAYFVHPVTAEVLVNLSLKYWPTLSQSVSPAASVVNNDAISHFMATLQQFIGNVVQSQTKVEEVEVLLQCVYLLMALNDQFKQHGIENYSKEIVQILNELLPTIWTKLTQFFTNILQLKNQVIEIVLNLLLTILELDENIDNSVKLTITEEFVGALANAQCDFLGDENDILNVNDKKVALKLLMVKVLSTFAVRIDNEYQLMVKQMLYEFADFDPLSMVDYAQAMVILEGLSDKNCVLNIQFVNEILKQLQTICQKRFKEYNVAVEVVNILKYLYVHLIKCDFLTDQTQTALLGLFKTLHSLRSNYGFKLSLALVQCLSALIQTDETLTWAKYKDELFVMLLPEYLETDHIVVRSEVVKAIAHIYKHSTSNTAIDRIKAAVFKKALRKLEAVHSNVTNEKIDKLFADLLTSIIIAANGGKFAKTALCELVLSIKKYNIPVFTIKDSLNLIKNNQSQFAIDNYLKVLLYSWMQHYKLVDFPHELFNCTSRKTFYEKHITVITPIILNGNFDDQFEEICKQIGISSNNVFEDCYAKLIGRNIIDKITDKETIPTPCEPDNSCMSTSIAHLKIGDLLTSQKGLQVIKESLDEIIVELLQYVHDPVDFEKFFAMNICITSPEGSFISRKAFETDALHFLTEKLQVDIVQYLHEKKMDKLQQLLLKLKANFSGKLNTEDKLMEFYRYAIFLDCILKHTSSNEYLQLFIVRDVTYSLINLIKHQDPTLFTLALKYLDKFIDVVLRSYAKHFAEFLIITTSSLVPYASNGNIDALKVLRKIIFSNNEHINKNLQHLDPIQEGNRHLLELREHHMLIRKRDGDLRDEIQSFLEEKQFKDCRTEGLKYLRGRLHQDLPGLKNIYLGLLEMRGILSEKSILHSLICTLVSLVSSDNPEESMEAIKCLGVLGAGDLTTMVLKSEDIIDTSQEKSSVYLFTSKIINLLTDCLLEKDINITKHASQALYSIMSSQGGQDVFQNDKTCIQGYLIPFVTKTHKNSSQANYLLSAKAELYNDTLTDHYLWNPEANISYEEWIINLVKKLLDGLDDRSFAKLLLPIVEKNVSFAAECFPFLINLLMDTCDRVKKLLWECIKSFFENHWNCQRNNYSNSLAMNKSAIRSILNAIHFVRVHRLSGSDKRGKEKKEIDLELNYLHVSQAAQYCSAHFSALMFAEKWYHITLNTLQLKSTQIEKLPIDLLAQDCTEEATLLRSILFQAYNDIGDKDALHGGCLIENIHNSNDLSADLLIFPSLGFELLHHDLPLTDVHINNEQMAQSLKDCALYNLAINTYDKNEVSYGDAYYECKWRLSQWNLGSAQISGGFEFHIYKLFNTINDNDKNSFNSWIQCARSQVGTCLKNISMECCKTLYGPLSKLERLQELEDLFTGTNANCNLQLLMDAFASKDEIQSDFQYFEPRVAQRIETIGLLRDKNYENANEIHVAMKLKLADIARERGNLQISKRILSSLSNIIDPETKAKVALMDTQILWKLDQCSASVSKLKHLLSSYTNNTEVRSTALKLCGVWMAMKQAEFPQNILENYFLPSIEILNALNPDAVHNIRMLYDAYNVLAKFADEEYQRCNEAIKSVEFERKEKSLEKMKAASRKLRSVKHPTDDMRRAATAYERNINIDEMEIRSKHTEKNTFLHVALKYYLYNLKYCKDIQIQIFRIFSLWLENKNKEKIMKEIKENLLTVESYKVLTILPQLVPHISTETDKFSQYITMLIEKCALEHPHHAIPVILPVANTNADDKYGKENANTTSNELRINGAKNLLHKLRKIDKLKNIIEQNEKISSGIIELAYTKSPNSSTLLKIPRALQISNIRNFTEALLPTCHLAIKPNLDYSNIVGIHKYKLEYVMVGGINAPKRIECIGTDGRARWQLVKGKDDLRQDAVMQQVFEFMNRLLRANKDTLNLQIRTYKVVPLSKRSGLLEWVHNSLPIGHYLVKAHKTYFPKDTTPDSAKNELHKAANGNHYQRLQKYLDICQRLQPVFHKFFETHFLQPAVWYEKRRAYTESVATSSMCGYVLGIGDRHVQNILIDVNTAEVIHIDFGIAFEQGRILPTPETVPFRLSRDIVDGMGVCGVEGTFRRTCEKTMEVLRRNGLTVQTILEVLLYDPLYAWSITPNQAYSKQMDDDSRDESQMFSDEEAIQINVAAERALSRLKQKLEGTDSGGNTSVETQVDRLIQQAKDPSNLSKLFYGWQAFM